MTVRLQTLFETPAKARLTAREYLDHPLSERKSDLIEGVFVMASPASLQHEELTAFLLATLSAFVGHRKLGRVLSSNAAYRLSDDNVYQPDVSFVRAERVTLGRETFFPGPPDIAVEVVSPSSRQYDTVEKKINYGRHGVGEYWLIDPIDERAVFYAQAEGQLLPIPAPAGQVRSALLDGYWLEIAWLFPSQGAEQPGVLDVARRQGLIA